MMILLLITITVITQLKSETNSSNHWCLENTDPRTNKQNLKINKSFNYICGRVNSV